MAPTEKQSRTETAAAAPSLGAALTRRLRRRSGVRSKSASSRFSRRNVWTLLFAVALVCVMVVHAAIVSMTGKAGFTCLMYGALGDPIGDSQAGAADTDIVGDPNHGSLYIAYDDNGTTDTSDDTLVFRMRIGNPTATNNFAGVAVVGMDANLDGKIDLFMAVDGRNNGQVVRLLDPGTGANISPSTTSTGPLPAGWLPNNGVYPFTTNNYNVSGVASSNDPHWNGNNDLNADGKQDAFVTWRIPMKDIATVLAIPSPVDNSGNYGPRGSTGISGYNQNTVVRYVSFTQTQSGPINGDLNGVGRSYDKNATFSSLGTMTAPMSAANPVSASDSVIITSPASGGLISTSQALSYTVKGTVTPTNSWVRLTITDTNNVSITNWVLAVNGGWTNSGLNLSSLADGTLTFTADIVTSNLSTTIDPGSTSSTITETHDTVPPTIGINPLATAGHPIISGTSTDVPVGSTITVTVDPNGDGILTDAVTYTVTVGTGGTWSVDTSVISPTTGTLGSSGFTSYAKITATGADAAGNTATATALDKPTVVSQISSSTTPTITGAWGGTNGGTDTLSVLISNTTTHVVSGGTLTIINNQSWSLVPTNTLSVATYDIIATATRSSTTATDATTNELQIVSSPTVTITGGGTSTTATNKPTISGGSSQANSYVTIRIDPNNDGIFTDAIYYTVSTDGSGNWSLNTATAVPLSGTFPVSGLSGTMGILATVYDSNGNSGTATQALTVSIPLISITSIFTTAAANTTGISNNADFYINRREDDAIVVQGTITNAIGQTITVVASDGDATTTDPSGTFVVATNGPWAISNMDLSALRNGYLTFSATVSGVSAYNTSYTHDTNVPILRFTTPTTIDKNSGSAGERVSGTSDLTNGSTIVVTYGSAGSVTNTVSSNGDWSVTPTFALSGSSIVITVAADTNATDIAGNRPAANITNTFAVAANFSPLTNAIVITNIAGQGLATNGSPLITNGNASAVSIAGIANVANGTTITITVTNSLGTQIWSTTTTTSGSNWITTNFNFSATTPNGPLIVTATVVNAGDTYTDAALPNLQLGTVNTASPTITITTIGDGNLSSSEVSSVLLSGTTTGITNGSTVFLVISDTNVSTPDVTATASVTGSGTWTNSTVNLSGLTNGPITVLATVTNSVGVSNTATANIDKVAPLITITNGPSSTNATPVISGTSDLPAGSTITITIDTGRTGTTNVTYTTTVQANGTWSVDTSSATPTSGTQQSLTTTSKVTASGSDSAGNTTSIVATTVTSITTDTGSSSTDFITSDQTLIFTGYADTNSTVQLTLNGTNVIGTVTPNASGVWTKDFTTNILAQGNYTLTALATKSAGVTATASQPFTIDTTAPAVAVTSISTDTGTGGDFITDDQTLIFNGTAEANSTVVVVLKNSSNSLIFSNTVTATGGSWSVDYTSYTLVAGTYTLTATATDTAGNSATATQSVVVDTSANISITSSTKTSNPKPTISGTTDIEVGRTITVMVGTNTYTTTVQTGGYWSVNTTNTLTSGSYPVTVTGTDIAGNMASATQTLTYDPNSPLIHIITPLDSGGNGILDATEDNSVTIHGTTTNVPAGGTIYVTISDGTHTLSATTTNTTATNGTWTLSPVNLGFMNNGVISVTATYYDDLGNPYSDTATVIHDKTGSTTIDSITQDTGIPTDFVTSDNTLIFNGSSSISNTVTLVLTNSSGTTIFTTNVVANSNGVWTFNYTNVVLPDGTYTLFANTTNSQVIVIDTVPPAGPVTVNSQTNTSTTPTITGTAVVQSGETLAVTVNGITYTTNSGYLVLTGTNWSLTIPSGDALTPASVSGGFNGKYDVTATISDLAGNTLSDSTSQELTIADTTAPVIDLDPTAAGSGNGSTLNNTATSLLGAAVSLDDNSDPATVVEASDLIQYVQIGVSGLLDGASEILNFGTNVVKANGSSGSLSDITVGGVQVNITFATNTFTIQRFDFTDLSAAEAQAVIRDITYQNTNATVSGGARIFSFTATDEAGNVSTPATATINVTQPSPTLTLTQTVTPTSTNGGIVTFTITVTNSGGSGGTLNSLSVILPTSPGSETNVSGSSTYNGGTIPNPTVSGTTNTWTGPFTIASGTNAIFTYQVYLPAILGSYTNLAYGLSGSSIIDTTAATNDYAPAATVETITNAVLITQTVTPTATNGGTVTFTITLTNGGTFSTMVDSISAILPTTPGLETNVAGTSTYNGGGISNPTVSGTTNTWTGPFTIPAGTTRTLTYQETLPTTLGTYTNGAYALQGTNIIDSTLSTADFSPALATVTSTNALLLTQTVSPSTILGGPVTFSITLTNPGSFSASVDSIESIFPTTPASVTYSTGSSTFNGGGISDPTATGNTNVWTGPFTIPAGTSRTLTYIVNFPHTDGTYTDYAQAFAGTNVIDTTATTADYSPATTTVSVSSTLLLTHTASPTTTSGGTVTYTVTVTNSGASSFSLDSLKVLLPTNPANGTYVSSSSTFNGSPISNPTASGNTETYTGPFVIPAGTNGVFTYQVSLPVTLGSYTNFAYALQGTNVVNDTLSSTDITPVPAIVSVTNAMLLSQTANPTATNGGTVTFSITVTNGSGLSTTLDSISAILPTSPGVETNVAGTSTYNGGGISNPTVSGTTNTWTGPFTIPANSTRTLTYQVTLPTTLGTYTNQAFALTGTNIIDSTLTTADFSPALATVTSTNAVLLTQTVSPTTVLGGSVTYSITLTNPGSFSATVDSIESIFPTTPATETYTAGTSTYNGGGISDPSASGSTNIWTGPFTIPAGTSRTLTYTVTVPHTDGSYTNYAFALAGTNIVDTTATTADYSPAATVLTVSSTLLLTHTASPVMTYGGTVTYTVTVTNSGATSFSLDSLKVLLPTNPATGTYISGSSTFNGVTIGNPTASGNLNTYTGPFSIPAGTNGVLTYQLTLPTTLGTYTNYAYALQGTNVVNGTLSSTDTNPVAVLVQVVDNFPPTLDSISNVTTNEDSGPQTVNLTGISDGDGGTQTLTITATSSDPSIVPNPTISYTSGSSTAVLNFQPLTNMNGVVTIAVVVTDNGSTNSTNFVERDFLLTINPVNDAPSFTKGHDQRISVLATAVSITNWAYNISPGPSNESTQTVSFVVTNDNNAMFSVQPAVDSSGKLTYTVNGSVGVATVGIYAHDNGGTANGGVDSSPVQTFSIEVVDLTLTNGFLAVADRGPYFQTGTILMYNTNGTIEKIITTSIKDPYEIIQDTNGNILMTDYEGRNGADGRRIYKINCKTLVETIVSDKGLFDTPFSLRFDNAPASPNYGKLIVADINAYSNNSNTWGAIFVVDPNTGAQTVLSSMNVGTGSNFYHIQGLAVDSAGTIFVGDIGDLNTIPARIYNVNPTNGNRTIVASGTPMLIPVGMQVISGSGTNGAKLVVVDAGAKALIEVDLSTTPATFTKKVPAGVTLNTPTHVSLDDTGTYYYLSDAPNSGGAPGTKHIFRVLRASPYTSSAVVTDGLLEQPRGNIYLQNIP